MKHVDKYALEYWLDATYREQYPGWTFAVNKNCTQVLITHRWGHYPPIDKINVTVSEWVAPTYTEYFRILHHRFEYALQGG